MGVALDRHFVGEFDGTDLADPADVVAPQVDQHQMLGDLLGIGQQLLLQRLVLLRRRTTRPRAGDRPHGHLATLQPRQNLRGGADHVMILEIEEEHVGRRVETAQRAIEIQRRRLIRDRHALGRHALHDVPGQHVLLDLGDRVLVALLAETGMKVVFGDIRPPGSRTQRIESRAAQFQFQRLEPLHRIIVGVRRFRIGVGPQLQTAGEVVEDDQIVAHHQQDVRHADGIGFLGGQRGAQLGLDIANGVVAEVAYETAVEARLVVEIRDLESRLEPLDPRQRVLDFAGALLLAIDDMAHGEAAHFDAFPAWQADDRVATPLLSALYRLEQKGPGGVSELEIGGERRIEIGQHLAGDRNTVVAGLRQLGKAIGGHHGTGLQQ